MGNSSKSTFLYLQSALGWTRSRILGSHGHPSFLPLYPLTCQEFFTFLLFCKVFTFTSLGRKKEGWEAHSNPDILCFLQFGSLFLYIKRLVLCIFKLEVEMSNPELYFQKTFPNLEYRLFLPVHYLIQCMTNCFKTWRDWKRKARRVLGEGKRIIQWRDQAHMNLVLVQSSNSS